MPDDKTSGRGIAVWQWIAGALLALVMFLLGGLASDIVVSRRLVQHEAIVGHPVMVEKANNMSRSQDEIKRQLDEIKRSQEANTKLLVRVAAKVGASE